MCPHKISNNERIRKIAILHNGRLFINEKEGTIDWHTIIDESQRHYAEQKKTEESQTQASTYSV